MSRTFVFSGFIFVILITALRFIALPVDAAASAPPVDALTSDDLDLIDPNLRSNLEQYSIQADDTDHDRLTQKEHQIVKLKVLLDRAGFSPGAINGTANIHFKRLLKVYQNQTSIELSGLSEAAIDDLLNESGGEEFEYYELTANDVSGPFTQNIPARIQDQTSLDKLNYQSVREAIAERFHMDEAFLARLNPEVDFSKQGTKVQVTNIGRYLDKWVARIRADKKLKQVTAFDQNGNVLAVYPASIGSAETPSPKGSFTVRNKAGFPAYTLSPDNSFEKVEGNRQLIVAPGPNNPVGSAWIGLSKKTYGIHGTPEPSNIGRAESHGCIRLTNWDALELARLVRTGIEVVIE